ncbi:hypothetical protein EAF00_002038 [Botryotinia globosa]|nr:hypothetical protein EAF00_002038 [Botryotinia globosa]
MNTSTRTFISPVKSESNYPACRTLSTPETSTRARKTSKSNGKSKSMTRKTSFSKIPGSPGSTRFHASPSMLRTSPIAFALTDNLSSRHRDTPSISSSDSGSTIREKIAEAMNTNQFAMPDRDLPPSPQNKTRTTTAKISSPLTNKGKSLPTTAISPTEPVIIKGVISQMKSPALVSGPIASPAVPKPDGSHNSSTYTPPKVFTAPSTPSATHKAAEPFLSRPIQKKTQSTPLLPKRHRSSTGSSRHVVASSAPSEFYEYQTINGTIDLPFPSKKGSSSNTSGYHSGVPGSASTSSSRMSLKTVYRGILHNFRPRVLSAYILFGASIIWLVWMTSNKILSDKKGNPGHSHGGIGGHVPPYGMSIATLTPSSPTHDIEEFMPVDKLTTWGVRDRQVLHNSDKSRPNSPSKSEPEESLWSTLCKVFVTLTWLFGIVLVFLFIRSLIENLFLFFFSGGEAADGGWREKV